MDGNSSTSGSRPKVTINADARADKSPIHINFNGEDLLIDGLRMSDWRTVEGGCSKRSPIRLLSPPLRRRKYSSKRSVAC